MFDLSTSLLTLGGESTRSVSQQQSTCTICLDRAAKEAFGVCGHEFCFRCLEEWRAAHDSCPLCRASVSGCPPPASRQASESGPVRPPPSPSWRHRPTVQPGTGTLHYRLTSDRERAERQHAERVRRRESRLQLERRMDRYLGAVFTPSGRPYEELPVVSLSQLRKELGENKRSLFTPNLSPLSP